MQAADATLTVQARIPRHASIRLAPPPPLTITEADIARGWVEAAGPLQVLVRSNVAEGYTLAFAFAGGQVRGARVQGPQQELVVDDAGANLARPAAGAGVWQETLQLRVRFELAPEARAGSHPWPLRISMLAP